MLWTIFVALAVLANAAQALQEPDWVGFRPVREIQELKPFAKSIFQIGGPGWYPPETIVDVQSANLPHYSGSDEASMKQLQLSVCIKNHIRNCPIVPGYEVGTAFLIRDSRTLVTVLHNVQNWLFYAKKYNPELDLKQVTPPNFLLNDNGGIALDPLKNQMRISFMNFSPAIFSRPYLDFKTEDQRLAITESEYMEFRVDKDLGPALRVGQILDSDSRTYLLGFSGRTDMFARFNAPDAPGDKLVATVGRIIVQSAELPLILGSNAAAVGGNSGGPALNAKGEVIGLVTSGYCALIESDPHACKIGRDGRIETETGILRLDRALLLKTWSAVDTTEKLSAH